MSASRVGLFAVIGAVAWFLAALFVRVFGDGLLTGDGIHMITYAACAPVTLGLTWGIARATGTEPSAMLAPMVIMVIIATFLDGIAITWFPDLYGGSGRTLANGAAFILWGVGWFLLVSLVMGWRRIGP